jgi:hypothetical protein
LQKVFRPGPAVLAGALLLAACGGDTPALAGPGGPSLPAAEIAARCDDGAYLSGRVVGAVTADLGKPAGQLACNGGPRPDGEGARLRFAREDETGAGLAVIIAMPELDRDTTGPELEANVTLIVEGEARFFSTQNRETCWADIVENAPVGDGRYAVAGELYCIAPLAEVNGDASITLDGLAFRGFVDRGTP